jgi:hypothetical protein
MAMISVQLRRIEGRSPASAYCQMTLGGLLILELIVPLMIMATAAFRPDRSESAIQTLNDLGWLLLVGVVSTGVVEMAVIGVAMLGDPRHEPIFPRWGAALNLVCALALAGGALSICFTTGPFAWNGLVAYWIPVFAFGFWIIGMSILLFRAIAGQERDETTVRIGDGIDPKPPVDVARLSAELRALRKEVALLSQTVDRSSG